MLKVFLMLFWTVRLYSVASTVAQLFLRCCVTALGSSIAPGSSWAPEAFLKPCDTTYSQVLSEKLESQAAFIFVQLNYHNYILAKLAF